jgi:phosphatidylserine/phosphatidylglycerophosphate/cardiolipin synthase-like enzyme
MRRRSGLTWRYISLVTVLAGLTFLPGRPVAAFDAGSSRALPAQGTVEAVFSPWQDVEGALVAAIRSARRTLHVQAYAFTSRALAAALVGAHRRGVSVKVLADREQAERMEAAAAAAGGAGIAVALEVRYAAAHNKILLIDAEGEAPAVITGSYNFTWSAQAKNAENVLILRGHHALARGYLDNWRRHRAEAMAWNDYLKIQD